jgi:hypothetical protein
VYPDAPDLVFAHCRKAVHKISGMAMKYKLGLAVDPRQAWLRNHQRTVYKYMTVLYRHEYDSEVAETAVLDHATRWLLHTLSRKQAHALLNRLVEHFVAQKRDPNCRNKAETHVNVCCGGSAECDFLHSFSLFIVYY